MVCPSIDKRLLMEFNYVSREEHAQLMNILSVSRREPAIKLCIAMFRDIFMFRTMVNATISQYTTKIEDLEARIEELEAKKKK